MVDKKKKKKTKSKTSLQTNISPQDSVQEPKMPLNPSEVMIVLAANNGLVNVVKAHLEADRNLANAGQGELNLLRIAIRAREVELVKHLLEFEELEVNMPGCKLVFANNTALPPIFEAALANGGSPEITTLLLQRKDIKVNVGQSRGQSRGQTAFNMVIRGLVSPPLVPAEKYLESIRRLSVAKILMEDPRVKVNLFHPDGCSSLHILIEQGKDDLALLLINRLDTDVNAPDVEAKRTPLHLAVQFGHAEIVKALLNREDIKVNLQDHINHTPFTFAVGIPERNLRIIQLLLEHKATDVNLMVNYNNDLESPILLGPLMFTILYCFKDIDIAEKIVKMMLERKDLDVNVKYEAVQNSTALHLSVVQGQAYLVQLLLGQKDIKVSFEDRLGYDPINIAIKGDHFNIVRLLLKHKCVNKSNALTEAIKLNNLTAVKIVLEFEDLEINFGPVPPLALATSLGHSLIVKALLKHKKVDVNARGMKISPSWLRAKKENAASVQMLVNNCINYRFEIDIEATDPAYVESIGKHGRENMVKKCLTHPCIISCMFKVGRERDTYDYPALHVACKLGMMKIAQNLLAHTKTHVNARTEDGNTSLSLAIAEGRPEIVKLLIEHADTDVNFKQGNLQSPLYLAVMYQTPKTPAILELLLQCERIDVNKMSEDRKNSAGVKFPGLHKISSTPFNYAARKGHTDIIKMFLKYKSFDVNAAESDEGQSALIVASHAGYTGIVKALLDREGIDLDVNKQRNDGKTAFSMACVAGHFEIVKPFLASNHDVDIDLADKEGISPLQYATTLQHNEVMKEVKRRKRADRKHKDKLEMQELQRVLDTLD